MPIIPYPKLDDIKRHFKHPTLTTIENEPDYEQMCVVREELFRNAIAIKYTFRREETWPPRIRATTRRLSHGGGPSMDSPNIWRDDTHLLRCSLTRRSEERRVRIQTLL